MADFQSNITFGKSKRDQEIENLELLLNEPPAEHCCDCTPSLCPEFLKPRLCDSCDEWYYS